MSTPVFNPLPPSSYPTAKPAPNREQYGVTELHLFDTFTRASYKDRFGVSAPSWNKNRRIKRWFDSSPFAGHSETVVYKVFENGSIVDLAMSVEEARAINLPGLAEYPKYSPPAETVAVIRSAATGQASGINAAYLCHRSEALELASEWSLGSGAVREASSFGPHFYYEWGSETRRIWVIDYKSAPLQASHFLRLKYAAGVGAPGHWDFSGSVPVWVSEVPLPGDSGERDPRPEVPVPVRTPHPFESFVQGFGGIWLVRRNDLHFSMEGAAKETLDLVRRISVKLGA